jgi:epoxyqueuosine reductase
MNIAHSNVWFEVSEVSAMNSKAIIEKARSLGATLAGIASTASLKNSQSYQVYGTVAWPAEAKSVLVLALVHKKTEPELDWWGVPGGTTGNQRLKKISISLKKSLTTEFNINARALPYQLADGGIFLKDAAALAGLGIIGANNLLITPGFGPCTRLRALLLEKDVTPTGPIDFSPCDSCDKPCWQACPQKAFSSGSYNSILCDKQMKTDETKARIEGTLVKYCRACELACQGGTS